MLDEMLPKYSHLSSSKQYIHPIVTTLEWMTHLSLTTSESSVSANKYVVLINASSLFDLNVPIYSIRLNMKVWSRMKPTTKKYLFLNNVFCYISLFKVHLTYIKVMKIYKM